jgi:hypothetical protein
VTPPPGSARNSRRIECGLVIVRRSSTRHWIA